LFIERVVFQAYAGRLRIEKTIGFLNRAAPDKILGVSTSTELILAFALPLSIFLLAFVVGCFEKRAVRQFESAQLGELPGYLNAMIASAIANGFRICDSGHHTKHKEKMWGALVLSPDRKILAVIGDGTISGLRSRWTVLMSRLKDGSFFFTCDQAGSAELDPMTKRQILMKADFNEMFTKHSARLAEGIVPLDFPEKSNWTTMDEVYRARVDRIVTMGLARYVDADRQMYCYSPWGSFRATILHGLGQVIRPSSFVRHYKRQPG